MAIVLLALAGVFVGGTISLVRQGATRFSIGIVGLFAVLAGAAGIAWLIPGDS